MSKPAQILSLAALTPDAMVSNDDLAKIVDTDDAWIVERTGIRRRRKLDEDRNASDLGLSASIEALARAGLEAGELTHLLAATCTPDYLSPSLACMLAGRLNAGQVMAFDFGAACTGFIYGLALARALLAENSANRILFVCAEALTKRLNWADRSTCVLFGDAAAACVLASKDTLADGAGIIEDVLCESDGSQSDLIIVGGGTRCNYALGDSVSEDFFISMQGRDTYKHAVRQMVNVCGKILERNALGIDDVDLFIPHQANIRIIEAVGARLNMPRERVFTNLADYGNTSSASIPLALSEALAQGLIRKGSRVLVTAFGAGLTFGAALLHF